MSIAGDARRVEVTVTVRKPAPLVFVDAAAENPLDNEPPEINADGVQLYVVASGASGGWTLVPDEASARARARRVRGWDALSIDARWAPADGGYTLTAIVTLPAAAGEVAVGVVVNETEPGRARRRGQLVLGGVPGGWIYLRGDRHAPDLLLPVLMVAGDLMF